MSPYNLHLIISSIFILLLTNSAILIRSDESWSEFWTPPQISHPYAEWMISDTYALSSPFESNLIRVMNSLAQNTSQTGFNVSSYGVNPNRVYGLLQCKGNTSQSQCRQCAHNVTRYVIDGRDCFQSVRCQIWFDSCYVRYANCNFVSLYENSGFVGSSGGISVNYSKSPDVFRAALDNLVSNLSAEVSRNGSIKGFAAGSAIYSTPSLKKVDAFVECSRDLSSSNCSACLARIGSILTTAYYQHYQIYHQSCLVRYISTESAYTSTVMGNSASRMLVMMWVLIGGLLQLSIFAPNCG